MNNPDFIFHGGGVAPGWQIRADQIAAVSDVYGTHGEQQYDISSSGGAKPIPPKLDSRGRVMFGPFCDIHLCGGGVITLENCQPACDRSLSTQAQILRSIWERTHP